MNIRKAEITDIDDWSRLRTELWPENSDTHKSEINEYFAGISIDIECVYIAEIESTIVGFIEVNVRNFAEGSRRPKVPYIEAWFVESTHRACGIGKALLQTAEHWALSNGYTELASDTNLDNTKSISVHNHLGFKETERVVCFIKKLKT